MGKRNHHFVPKFYLRGFASSTPKQINLFNLERREPRQDVSLADQCYKHHFYGETDDMENALEKLESGLAPVLRSVVTISQLPAESSEQPHY